jgi:hypothetical protein
MSERSVAMVSKPMAVAIAIRRNKFERNGLGKHFDETNISETDLEEAKAAIAAARAWDDEYYHDAFLDEPYGSERI